MTRTCSDCPKPITKYSKSGRCKSCSLAARRADPAAEAKRIAGIRRKFQDPRVRARMAAQLIAGFKKARECPQFEAWLRENARIHFSQRLHTPEVHAKIQAGAPERIKKYRQSRMRGIPETYWGQYRYLRDTKLLPAPEARAVIMEQIAADRARMSPFERQMEALQKGAQLVAKPVIRTREHDFSLIGGSLA